MVNYGYSWRLGWLQLINDPKCSLVLGSLGFPCGPQGATEGLKGQVMRPVPQNYPWEPTEND